MPFPGHFFLLLLLHVVSSLLNWTQNILKAKTHSCLPRKEGVQENQIKGEKMKRQHFRSCKSEPVIIMKI